MSMKPAILERLRGVQRSGDGWTAFCPSHPDEHTRSLSVSLAPDGKTLLHCFVGCTVEQIVAAANMSMADLMGSTDDRQRPRRAPLTLAAFAEAKGLPVDFLRELGVVEDARGLRITYRLADGSEAPRQRRRTALMARDGSTWDGPRGESPVAYGLWRLDDALDRGELWLVEGETDALSAWLHNVPALGLPGADMAKVLTADVLRDVERLWIIQEPDRGGSTFVAGCAQRLAELAWSGEARIVRLPVKDLNDLHRMAGDGFADALARAQAEAVPLAAAGGAASPAEPADESAQAEPELRREGFDLILTWPGGLRFDLSAIRDGRDGVRGELTVTQNGRRLSWGTLALSSTQAREALRKKLGAMAPGPPWGEYLEEACWRLTQAARQGEPMVTLTGAVASPTRELLPRLLYEGEPTLIFGDGDTGKSLLALSVALAVHSGTALPFGLKPVRAVPAAFLDWETSQDTVESRSCQLAAGLGIDPPAILYKRMTRPLVDEAPTLAAEFARRGVGFVVIDSKMFAIAGGDGAAFHEPITAFYNALRLFAPAASLVLNHVTGADARSGAPARPFGGAFAFNGPRLVWEVKRDHNVDDATAIILTCRKANNLSRRPAPFGLQFQPGDGTITIFPLDLAEATPQTLAGASLPQRVRLALAGGALTIPELAEQLGVGQDTVGRVVRRLAGKAILLKVAEEAGRGTPSTRWGLAAHA